MKLFIKMLLVLMLTMSVPSYAIPSVSSYQLPKMVKQESHTVKAGLPGKLLSTNQIKMCWQLCILLVLVLMMTQAFQKENKIMKLTKKEFVQK